MGAGTGSSSLPVHYWPWEGGGMGLPLVWGMLRAPVSPRGSQGHPRRAQWGLWIWPLLAPPLRH